MADIHTKALDLLQSSLYNEGAVRKAITMARGVEEDSEIQFFYERFVDLLKALAQRPEHND